MTPDDLAALTERVNDAQRALVPRLAYTPEAAASLIESESPWEAYFPDEAPWRSGWVCAYEPGTNRLLGAAGGVFQQPHLTLDWLYARAEAGAAQATLRRLDAWANEQGCTHIQTGRNRFGAGWLGLTDGQFPAAALADAGWQATRSWVIHTGELEAVPADAPCPLPDAQVTRTDDPPGLCMTWQVVHAGASVAECAAWMLPPHWRHAAGGRGWISVEWLGVEPPFQRRGLGMWLLRLVQGELVRQGWRQVVAWTEDDNTAARGLLARAGFRAGHRTTEYERQLA
jgi:ribosomal protein S18 acetylase RimI-like enzyme